MDRHSKNWKITLAYDGGDFQGWQVQPQASTIQGALAEAIERMTGERVLPQGAGRTDAGVHALGQVASFHLLSPVPAENLHSALNRILPQSIRILRVEPAPADFHARHSARAKTYEYRVYQGAICPPMLARYVYRSHWKFDIDAMRSAAQMIVGENDFTSFAASEPQTGARSTRPPAEAKSCVRIIYASDWAEESLTPQPVWSHGDDALIVYRITGSGFLHHMVRNLVGTFLDVGRGRTPPHALPEILAARSRSAAGPTVSPNGLFLMSVDYSDETA